MEIRVDGFLQLENGRVFRIAPKKRVIQVRFILIYSRLFVDQVQVTVMHDDIGRNSLWRS